MSFGSDPTDSWLRAVQHATEVPRVESGKSARPQSAEDAGLVKRFSSLPQVLVTSTRMQSQLLAFGTWSEAAHCDR